MTLAWVPLVLAAVPAWTADLAEIRQRGSLRVLAVLDRAEPEFFSLKSEQAPGLDVELLIGFAKAQKLELKVVPAVGWAGLVPSLVAGKGDLIAGRFAATAQRQRFVEFSREVFPTRSVVVSRAPRGPVTTLDELKAERVGTIAGTSMLEGLLAAGISPSAIDTTLDSGELQEALRSGRVTAAVWWLEGAIQAQRKDGSLNLGLVLRPESLAYAVRKGDTALLAAIDQYLQVAQTSGVLNRLIVKYFGDAAPTILKRAREAP